MGVKRLMLWLFLLVLAVGILGCGTAEKPQEPPPEPQVPETPGYRSVCFDGESFLAVGTGGRIDRILADKTVTSLPSAVETTLNGVAAQSNRCVAVGDSGTIVTANGNGTFQAVDAGTKQDLLAVTAFGSAFVAVGRGGTVLTSVDGTAWSRLSVEVTNDFISVASNGETCLAVTREGQVLIMQNLSRGEVLDYNQVYKNLGTTFHMRAISCPGQGYLVMGTAMDNEDAPVLFKTADGELWTEIYLDTINNQMGSAFYPLRMNAAAVLDDQILVGAEGGKLLTLTSCVECTKLNAFEGHTICSLAQGNGCVLLAGNAFWFDILAAESVRTDSIKAEQARTDQLENGAVIVDVRSAEEYITGHVPGALHIPLDKVAEHLERLVPDKTTKLIFYCSVGGRSQTALETARAAGYAYVYNLGGLENGDWPYELDIGAAGAFEETE